MTEAPGELTSARHDRLPRLGLRYALSPFFERWLREPLVHFVFIGLALFAADAYLHGGRGGVQSSRQIVIGLDELRQMETYFESQWHRAPTPGEFQAMVEDKVREEVLYREALAQGLDKDDTIVKRRMAQKMEFLAEDVAAAHEPASAELKSWFAKNADKFTLPSRISFRHLYFSPDTRGKSARENAAGVLARIAGEPEDSKLAVSLSDRFMFSDYYRDLAPGEIAKEFGPPFAVAVEKLRPGSWQGPIESGYGWHLVFVDTVIPGRIPAFEEVESDVKTAWLSEQKATAWRRAYAEMRGKYTVLLPGPPSNDTAAEPRTVPHSVKNDVPGASGEGAL